MGQLGKLENTVNEISVETLEQHCELIRTELTKKLRQSRLAPAKSDAGIMVDLKDPEFGSRFGWSLGNVGNADIAALTLVPRAGRDVGGVFR